MRTAILTALLLASPSLFAQKAEFIPIAAARQQPQNTVVTVIGLVTVRPGEFASSSSDEGFAIQDQTAGIWISVAHKLPLRVGQLVRVTGPLGALNQRVQIAPASAQDVQPLPHEQLRVATGQVGAATLGYLITVEGTITSREPDAKFGYKIFVNDGSGVAQIYVNRTTDIDPNAPSLQIGKRVRVTGFGNQFDTSYEVDPRSRRDLVALR